MQARRISSEYIYAPLGPICLEHQDLCRGYSALGPSRVPPIYFYGLVLAAAGTRNREKVLPVPMLLTLGCARENVTGNTGGNYCLYYTVTGGGRTRVPKTRWNRRRRNCIVISDDRSCLNQRRICEIRGVKNERKRVDSSNELYRLRSDKVICSTIKFSSFLGTDFPFHVTLSFPLGFSSASFTPVIEGPPSDLKINTRDPRSNKDEYLYADRIFCAPFGLHLSVTTNGIRT